MNPQRILGLLLILFPFAAIIGWMVHEEGWKLALLIVALAAGLIGMIYAGVGLMTGSWR